MNEDVVTDGKDETNVPKNGKPTENWMLVE